MGDLIQYDIGKNNSAGIHTNCAYSQNA